MCAQKSAAPPLLFLSDYWARENKVGGENKTMAPRSFAKCKLLAKCREHSVAPLIPFSSPVYKLKIAI